MEYIIISILGALLTSIVVLVVGGWITWKMIARRIVEPKTVFEEPGKEKIVLVPGKGVFGIQNKRPAKFISDQREWVKEQNAKKDFQ